MIISCIQYFDIPDTVIPKVSTGYLMVVFFLLFLQSEKFSRNASLLDSGNVQQTAAMLANATLHTEKYYGSDVKVAYRLTQSLLQHESSQQGFNLTATQDVHFNEVNGHMLSDTRSHRE